MYHGVKHVGPHVFIHITQWIYVCNISKVKKALKIVIQRSDAGVQEQDASQPNQIHHEVF